MATPPIFSVFDKALSDHQRNAMRDEVYVREGEGLCLDVAKVHGNAVRGLARHGLLAITSGQYARLTPLGVRLHAALDGTDEVEALHQHAASIAAGHDSALSAVLVSAGYDHEEA